MPGLTEKIAAVFFRLAASGLVPASWFRAVDPREVPREKRVGRLRLEIVSHCWRYGHLLAYQLSSLVRHRTDKLDVTMTVFHAAEDESVAPVLERFGRLDVPGVTWNWRALPKEQLFRRGIGRNLAAKGTEADWIWFCDCDIVFHRDCLATLADELQGRDDALVFPATTLATPLLEPDDPILTRGLDARDLVEVPPDRFRPHGGRYDRAKGAYQITHGDVARACGYCETIGLYQAPSERWRKTYEDRAFRWLLGTQGEPVNVPGVCQIRHAAKGRYKHGSKISRLRAWLRRSRDP